MPSVLIEGRRPDVAGLVAFLAIAAAAIPLLTFLFFSGSLEDGLRPFHIAASVAAGLASFGVWSRGDRAWIAAGPFAGLLTMALLFGVVLYEFLQPVRLPSRSEFFNQPAPTVWPAIVIAAALGLAMARSFGTVTRTTIAVVVVIALAGIVAQTSGLISEELFFDAAIPLAVSSPLLWAQGRRSNARVATCVAAMIAFPAVGLGSWEATRSNITPLFQLADVPTRGTAFLPLGETVLAVGGEGDRGPVRGVWRWDRARGSWSRDSLLIQPRTFHTATRLADGRVLAVGGCCDGWFVPLRTSEIYDEATRRWTRVKDMIHARCTPITALLDDGRVLVVGGTSGAGGRCGGPRAGDTTDSAEIYDPAADTWTAADILPTKVDGAVLLKLGDGRVLLIRGDYSAPRAVTAPAYFDPSTGLWSLIQTDLPDGSPLAAHLQLDGQVLILLETRHPRRLVRLDPATGTWTEIAALPRGHRTASAFLSDGRLLVTGGTGRVLEAVAETYVYDPASRTRTEVAGLHTPRRDATLLPLPDGSALVVGGTSTRDRVRETELFEPRTGSWLRAGSLAWP